jgi:leucyl-tRNA synthetase
VRGQQRFVARLWRVAQSLIDASSSSSSSSSLDNNNNNNNVSSSSSTTTLLLTAKKVLKSTIIDAKRHQFNTLIASLMTLTNQLQKVGVDSDLPIRLAILRMTIILLSPFAPHLSFELWNVSFFFQMSQGDL